MTRRFQFNQTGYRTGLALSLLTALCMQMGGTFAASDTLGLPPVPIPQDNPQTPAKIALGKRLFHDQRLSADGKVSCATCHQAEKAFTDGLPLAQGIHKQSGTRNTPSLLNVAYLTSLFWDGRQTSLEAQAKEPLLHPREHGLKDSQALLQRIRSDQQYVAAFNRAFGVPSAGIAIAHLSQALAAFERTLILGDSPFDRYYFAGDQKALSPAAQQGLALFQGRAQCATCHTLDKTSALFTDQQFHSLAIGLKKIEPRIVELTTRVAHAPQAKREQLVLEDANYAELGRFLVTQNPADIGKFKTPSLRNVGLTAPYMHDGSIATLAEAVDFEVYYRGLSQNRPLILTPQEKLDLIDFLKSLTSPVRYGKQSPVGFSNTLY